MAPRTFRERVDLRLLGCVLLSVLVGIFLRVWRAGSPLLFQDELFAVAAAADLRYTQILTHFGLFFDHCIPLSLYAKLLTDTIGLDEWTLRLPGIVAGVATLCLVAAIGWRELEDAAAVLVVAWFAGSPYVVYLTREARPYPIVMLLVGLACLFVFAWMRSGGRARLLAAAAFASLAPWFHPMVLPSVGVLGLATIGWAWSARRPGGWRDVLWAAALFSALALLLLGPPAGDLLHGWALKGTRGHMTLGTVATGLMLLLPTPVEAPLLFWLALAALGFVALGRRHPRESAILSAMTVVQVLALRLAQPMGVEAPHICLRYLAHLLPFLFAVAVAPIPWLATVLGARPRSSGIHGRRAAGAVAERVRGRPRGDRSPTRHRSRTSRRRISACSVPRLPQEDPGRDGTRGASDPGRLARTPVPVPAGDHARVRAGRVPRPSAAAARVHRRSLSGRARG